MTITETRPEAGGVGVLLKDWRQRRRRSQLELSNESGISTRHLSFVETGRSRPSRDMVLRIADQLEVPLRERNTLLLAAGYAPAYDERTLEDDDMTAIREALDLILTGYEPFPALVVDRDWNLVQANNAVAPLIADVAPELLDGQVNVLRLSLHPDGMSSRIVNLAEWRGHLLDRLAREFAVTGSAGTKALHDELSSYPGGITHAPPDGRIAVPMRLRSDAGELSFISTVTTFGTAVDISVAELTVEAFLPADAATAAALRDR
ncbi:helix-turn-helix domain-containing protein [Nocardioides jensenii]|uniref:helix-turn-helix domain-containing protein n=1 Tax=Nocardioides jensenii TaxID=1843 RepID=UPI001C3F45D1|nr:helix-turn-helix transcriptional regulator [Nocardioides jensenii]